MKDPKLSARSARVAALGVLLALVACASDPTVPNQRRTQTLSLRTDPPQAACALFRDGRQIGAVDATPGDVVVPLDAFYVMPSSDADFPRLEVACRKEGYIEHRETFTGLLWYDLRLGERAIARRQASDGTDFAAKGVLALGQMAAMLPYGAGVPVALGALGLVGALGAGNIGSALPHYYEYRDLPQFVLTPVSFETTTARDAYFQARAAACRATRDAERAHVDATCRFWPCKEGDPTPCADPLCENLRKFADDTLATDLARLDALRAQVRVDAGRD